jgi:hypothetical protein
MWSAEGAAGAGAAGAAVTAGAAAASVVTAGVELIGVVLQAIIGTKRTATAAGSFERFTNIGTSAGDSTFAPATAGAPARAQ